MLRHRIFALVAWCLVAQSGWAHAQTRLVPLPGSAPLPAREPLILVHGIKGGLGDFRDLVRRFNASHKFRIYVLEYDDYHHRTSLNGDEFARELRELQRVRPGPITIVAHSLGGIVARRALNNLYPDMERFGAIRLFTADTPWHGYAGPSDFGIQKLLAWIGGLFIPDGLIDMRAGSWMFRSPTTALNEFPVHEKVSIHVAFSRDGKAALDYRKGKLKRLPAILAYENEEDLRQIDGAYALRNFWAALRSASAYPAFVAEMLELRLGGRLSERTVGEALARHFPEYPGDHAGILREQPGVHSYLDTLSEQLLANWGP